MRQAKQRIWPISKASLHLCKAMALPTILQKHPFASLQAKAVAAKSELSKLNQALANEAKARALRDEAFLPLKKLSTRLYNALKVSDVPKMIVESFASQQKKMQGRRVSSKLTKEEIAAQLAEGKVVKQISASQQSYDSRIEVFDKQIALLATVPEYQPNEAELQVATLQAQYANLKTANTAVVDLATATDNQRLTRNETMYNSETGMLAMAASVKNYVKSVYGTTSPQYKQIAGIAFKTIRS